MITMRQAYAEIHFRSRGAQHLLPITDRFDADSDQRSVDRRNTGTEWSYSEFVMRQALVYTSVPDLTGGSYDVLPKMIFGHAVNLFSQSSLSIRSGG